MNTYLLLAKNGKTPPKYEHNLLQDAIDEANRIHQLTGDDIRILKVVGIVKSIEIPVVKKEMIVSVNEQDYNKDLPF